MDRSRQGKPGSAGTPGRGLPALRVLVVDDNHDMASSLEEILRNAGHDVRSAGDGASGVETAVIWLPDVVLLDIRLPDLDGHEVAARMRRAGLKTAWIAAVSGNEPRSTPEAAVFDHHFLKPIDCSDLIARLDVLRADRPEPGT